MQVNIITYYLCSVLLVLDVLNALHCFRRKQIENLYSLFNIVKRGNEMPSSTKVQTRNQTISSCFQSLFFHGNCRKWKDSNSRNSSHLFS